MAYRFGWFLVLVLVAGNAALVGAQESARAPVDDEPSSPPAAPTPKRTPALAPSNRVVLEHMYSLGLYEALGRADLVAAYGRRHRVRVAVLASGGALVVVALALAVSAAALFDSFSYGCVRGSDGAGCAEFGVRSPHDALLEAGGVLGGAGFAGMIVAAALRVDPLRPEQQRKLVISDSGAVDGAGDGGATPVRASSSLRIVPSLGATFSGVSLGGSF